MSTRSTEHDTVTLSLPHYKIRELFTLIILTLFILCIAISQVLLSETLLSEYENQLLPYIAPALCIIGVIIIIKQLINYKKLKSARLHLNTKSISSTEDLSKISDHPQYRLQKFDLRWSSIIKASIHPTEEFRAKQHPNFIKLTLHTKHEEFDIYPISWCNEADYKRVKKYNSFKKHSASEIESLILLSPLMRFLAKQNINVNINFEAEKVINTSSTAKKIAGMIAFTLVCVVVFTTVFRLSPPSPVTSLNQAESPSQQYTLPTHISEEFNHFNDEDIAELLINTIFMKGISALDINQQGTLIAAGIYDRHIDHIVKIWDIKTKALLHTFTEHPKQIRTLALSPDNRWLVAGTGAFLYWWDIENNKKVAELESPDSEFALSSYAGFFSTQFSPNGKYLAAANWDGSVLIWETDSRRLLHHMTRVQRSPSNAQQDNALDGNKPLVEAIGHNDSVDSIAFSPDSLFLASGGLDRAIKIWNVKTGKLVKTFTGHEGWVDSLAFSPDGRLLVSGGDGSYYNKQGSVHIWEVTTGKLLNRLVGHESEIRFVDFRADGKVIVSSDQAATSIFWEVSTGALLEKLTKKQIIKFDSTGERVISVGGKTISILDNQTE